MNIAIAGVSGFVGQNLEIFLSQKGCTINKLSLRNPDWNTKLDGKISIIIHLAGKAHDTTNTSSEDEYFAVNRDLTISLFDFFLNSDIKDFFYFSSVKAVADTVDGILKEDVVGAPKTPYGQSKLQAEQYLLNKELPLGKRLFILRPCMIHGPGNKGNLNLLYKVVQKGIPYPLAAFSNQRSFLSIANLNYILERLISDPLIPGGVYNVADDVSLSTNEVIQAISEAKGNKARLWRINPSMIKFIAKLGDKLRLPLNSERLKKLTESYVVSNDKIKKALNIEKLPVSAKDGLLETIKSFHSN